jgi:hypothetical protein
MDKELLLLLMVGFISSMFGLMERVKHKWETSWFSTVKNPKWLADWLNPHVFSLRAIKPVWIGWLFRYPLAAVDDFWHFLKFLLLMMIFTTIWIAYHECSWIVWMIICTPLYCIPFELNFCGFNKKV